MLVSKNDQLYINASSSGRLTTGVKTCTGPLPCRLSNAVCLSKLAVKICLTASLASLKSPASLVRLISSGIQKKPLAVSSKFAI